MECRSLFKNIYSLFLYTGSKVVYFMLEKHKNSSIKSRTCNRGYNMVLEVFPVHIGSRLLLCSKRLYDSLPLNTIQIFNVCHSTWKVSLNKHSCQNAPCNDTSKVWRGCAVERESYKIWRSSNLKRWKISKKNVKLVKCTKST